MTAQPPFYEEVCHGLLDEIVGLTKRVVLENRRKFTKKDLVNQALATIQAQEGNISVAELADRYCVSKDYLRHLFQEYTAQSPVRHIITARMAKAQSLLTNTTLSMIEIARLCSFEDVYYFSRLFKKETSYSPSRYRTEKCKENDR
jgi:transcriptional regulator GlxA family with amidase domain